MTKRAVRGTAGLTTEVKTVTPQVAREWLKNRAKNRNISPNRVKRHAQAIERGEWVVGQPIMFNCDGTLIDGQHRLHAVIEAKKAVEFLVIRGFDRDHTFGRLDDVQERKLRHWLQIQGEANPDCLAAVIKMAATDESGRIPTVSTGDFILTGPEGLEFLEAHPELRESVNKAPGTVNRLLPRAMACFCHWKFAKIDKAVADSFFVDLTIDAKEGHEDAMYLLRERLRSNRRAKTKLPRTEILALVYKTWNAVRTGGRVRQLKWVSRSEPFPVPQ